MAIRIKLLPCFSSSKWPKTELIVESVLSRGPLWKNTNFVERNSSSKIIPGPTGQPLCQELGINLGAPGAKLEYTPTGPGCAPLLTLAACHPSWDNYLDLNETLAEMAQCLMEEDGQQGEAVHQRRAPSLRRRTLPKIVACYHPTMILHSCPSFRVPWHPIWTLHLRESCQLE